MIVKKADLEALVGKLWLRWANSKDGLGPPMMEALLESVKMAGGTVDDELAP
jgi:hypothetical protein